MGAPEIVERAREAGLDVIGIADHNTCENFPGIHEAAAGVPVVLPCIETQSAEDIHILCVFPDYETAAGYKEWLWRRIRPIPNDVEHFGYLAQQATVFGQHVHVGCQSGDDAIYLLHGLSRFVPHFIALNAASPWFDSTDSRFACSRLNRFSSYPDNGPMPWVADWQGFRRLFRQLSYTSMIDSMKDLHWDIRPSPQFGTVEVRVMDTPLTLAQAIHIAGFIQTLACWLLTERPFKHQPDDYLLYPFNRYQACRYGLDGTLTDVRSGEQRSIRQEILQLADRLAPFAHQLKATAALEAVVRQAKSPQSEAQQMRDFIANGGSLSGLVQKHCEIWAA